ncbi:MAG: hypothetical protein KJ893_08330 [Candidatus Omnitrophica bacterium]|nr:hypothetical protein [Candidatus Omnitrophota bacterium]MCG2711248.1 hypothetical protein [Candidatus Omnitrophota bacterium]
MAKAAITRERLSIDVLPEEHRQIKVHAALRGETIREYVVESVRERLCQETEARELSALTMHLDQDPTLKKLWDNEKDAAYDKI